MYKVIAYAPCSGSFIQDRVEIVNSIHEVESVMDQIDTTKPHCRIVVDKKGEGRLFDSLDYEA